MRNEDFEMFAALLRRRSGLVLTKDKAYLLESRLTPLARKWQVKTVEELANRLRTRKEEGLAKDITEAMTTNESSFFRDRKPFDLLREVVFPRLLETRRDRRQIRILSAACSSGQEAYSVAITLDQEKYKFSGWNVEILGTDISREMVERAQAGLYSQFEVQRGLPIQLLIKYFQQVGDKWQLKPEIRKMASFREHNLLGELASLGRFDIVFLRNVLIYFDLPTKSKVLSQVARILAPDGYLFLGGAETVLGVSTAFKPLEGQRGLYIPAGAAGMAAPRAAAG